MPRPAFNRPQSVPRWLIGFACATLAGLLLGILGPFGSYLNDGVAWRVAYWAISCWAGLLLYSSAAIAAQRIAAFPSWAGFLALAVATALASVPQTILTRWLAFRLWPDLADRVPDWGSWYGQVLTIGVVGMSGYAVVRTARAPAAAQVAQAPVPAARDRAILGGEVVALQMEDHYVRVHAAAGSQLVLMTMGEAIGLLGGLDGERTHRSWWVARHAVDRIEGSPRAMRVHLINGITAPVARNAVARLRSAGWLDTEGARAP